MYKQFCKALFSVTKNFTSVSNNVRLLNSASTIDTEAGRMVWMDLEMTGLDVEKCKIMEIACLITDANLNIIAEGPDIVIHQPSELLDNMDPWCIKQHAKTGLTEESRSSTITTEEAETTMLHFLYKYTQPCMSPLAGNTVYIDRTFLKKYMPRIDNYLHYRIIDVSTVKELCRRWSPEVYNKAPKKQFLHRSKTDIKESVEELRWYREYFMKITV